jgi:hypothetical protein
MNPRLRVTLICIGVALIVVFVMAQAYFFVLNPFLQWRIERNEDRITYQRLAEIQNRTEIEQTLSDWKAETQQGTYYCDLLKKRHVPGSDGCNAADHEIVYQRKRAIQREAPLTPLQIVVVYDHNDHVIITSTLD